MATKKNTAIKRGDKEYNYYRITRTVGHEWKDGKKIPIKKQFTGTSKGNAEQKYKKYLENLHKEKENCIDNTKPLGDLMQYYADNVLSVDKKYAHGTRLRYLSSYNVHIKGADFTRKAASHVSAADIQIFYNSLDVTLSVIKGIQKFMVAFFKWASVTEKIPNVMDSVIVPEKKDNKRNDEIVIWSQAELKAIIAALTNHRLRFFVILDIYTGLRISELIALKYTDIENAVLYLQRQFYRGAICPPKYDSKRYLPLHEIVLQELELHKKWHQRDMERYNYKTNYIFTSRNGTFLDERNVRRALKRLYKAHGIPYKKFHAFRATFCTELCKAGVPLQVASKLMGHKSVEVTAKYYTFISKSEMKEAVNQLPDFAS